MIASTASWYRASPPRASLRILLPDLITIAGRRSCWLREEPVRQSMTTRLAMPVDSSSASVLDTHARAIRNAVMRALGAVGIDDRYDHVAHHRHDFVIRVLGDVLALELDLAVEVRFDERLFGDLRGAADVKRAHGELRARLTDRLRGNDAHCFAHVDWRTAGKIAPVAGPAHAVGCFTGQHRADFELLNAAIGDDFDLRLRQQRRAFDQRLAA